MSLYPELRRIKDTRGWGRHPLLLQGSLRDGVRLGGAIFDYVVVFSVPLSASRSLTGTFGDGGFILARIKITKLVALYPVTGFCLLKVRHPSVHLTLQKRAKENALGISEVMVIGQRIYEEME